VPRYGEGTSVPASKSKREIEDLLVKHDAKGVGIATSPEKAQVMFAMADRTMRFSIPLPTGTERYITHGGKSERARSEAARTEALAAEQRRIWRALLLVLRAKLESVESGIETVEEAFLANVVLPDGSTVAENVQPALESVYTTGQVRSLLALT
jgi:hypothetical protein